MTTKNNILLSIVTVVRNAADEIEQTLRSIQQLKTPTMEYIILDGGSTDGTQEIIARYSSVIDYTHSAVDGGIYQAMNEALHHAHGHFVLNINAGDALLDVPWGELEQAQKDGIDLLAFPVLEEKEQVHPPLWDNRLILYNTLPHQGCCYRTDLFRQYRYDIRYKVYGDFDLNQRLYQAKINVRLSHHVIAFHDQQGISNNRAYGREAFRVVYRNYGLFTLLRSWFHSKMKGVKRRLRKLR